MKKITLLIILSFALSNINAQSKVSGVVTYFFNDYQGNKPDLGATVYVIDSTKIKDFDEIIYYKYYSAMVNKKIAASYEKMINDLEESNKKYGKSKYYKSEYDKNLSFINEFKEKRDGANNDLIKSGFETKEKFDELDRISRKNFYSLETNSEKEGYKTTVDAVGKYEINIEPGIYYILIKSNGRKALSVTEIGGKIFYKKIKVIKDRVIDVSTNFTL